MFDFLKRKKEINGRDFVWKNETIKYNSLINHINQPNKIILLYFFEDTKQKLETVLTDAAINYSTSASIASNIWLMKADTILHKFSLDNREIIFAEHHPSFAEEKTITTHLSEQLDITEITFYISFEDELLKLFGATRILELMDKLGFKDDEMIEHQMVSKSIQNAQQKIDEQVKFPSCSRNRKDWFEMNLPKT